MNEPPVFDCTVCEWRGDAEDVDIDPDGGIHCPECGEDLKAL